MSTSLAVFRGALIVFGPAHSIIHSGMPMTELLLILLVASPAERTALASAAVAQVGVTRQYDPSYTQLHYPGGDVPIERGVCADVVVRAFRKIGLDLQVAVHEDMKRNFAAYPQLWGLRVPDANIDHRRVPNLMKFFERNGKALRLAAPYEPGDVVAWRLANGLYHIGVVSNVRNSAGTDSMVVHNIGDGTQLEDVLRAFTIIGHYRW
ncbi:MAG TPA: DUF1287 domain-containing protein [Thermoanaerobaculia bacterium]|nr:DUF1287 domain-containing protein [Thermoanaerobaculia bacterium]